MSEINPYFLIKLKIRFSYWTKEWMAENPWQRVTDFLFFRYIRDKVYLDIGRSDFSIIALEMFVILSYKIY